MRISAFEHSKKTVKDFKTIANCTGHENAVSKVITNPFNGELFCSAGFDQKINIWELDREVFGRKFGGKVGKNKKMKV